MTDKKEKQNTEKTESQQQLLDGDFQEELKNSYEMIKKLLPFMVNRNIPAFPANYRIFYDYLLDNNPTLTQMVKQLLEKNTRFHTQLSESLYEHFYVSDNDNAMQTAAIKKATSDFMSVSQDLADRLSTAKDHTSRYQQALSNSSKQLINIPGDELQSLVKDLLSETETALAAHETFSSHITEANALIDQLRCELENQTNLANIDDLTQLHNRRHLHREAPAMMKMSHEAKVPLSAIMFDLDFFKRINDTWGHNFGDKVLQICSKIIKTNRRQGDLAIRLGGEEFLLLAQPMTLEEAAAKAEEIRLAIYNTDITVRGERLPVTISAGVAQYVAGEPLEVLIDRADKALYRAKREGRNTIRLAENNI